MAGILKALIILAPQAFCDAYIASNSFLLGAPDPAGELTTFPRDTPSPFLTPRRLRHLDRRLVFGL